MNILLNTDHDKYRVWCTRVKGSAKQAGQSRPLQLDLELHKAIYFGPKFHPNPCTNAPLHHQNCRPAPAPKNTLVDRGKKTGEASEFERLAAFRVFFWSRRGPRSQIRIVGECKFGAGRLAAASRYGWRETKLRLALHLASLSSG